jgi:hypothetical protein
MTYIEYIKTNTFLDRIYYFFFYEHKKQFVLYLSTFTIAIFYISINVLILGRNEQKTLYESILFTIMATVIFPVIYCGFVPIKKGKNSDVPYTFHALFYRKTNTKLIQWKEMPKLKSNKMFHRKKIVYYDTFRADTKMHSHILCD